jgi:hypothetical protein
MDVEIGKGVPKSQQSPQLLQISDGTAECWVAANNHSKKSIPLKI